MARLKITSEKCSDIVSYVMRLLVMLLSVFFLKFIILFIIYQIYAREAHAAFANQSETLCQATSLLWAVHPSGESNKPIDIYEQACVQASASIFKEISFLRKFYCRKGKSKEEKKSEEI